MKINAMPFSRCWKYPAGFVLSALFLSSCATVSKISYSSVSVPEEGGIKFEKITEDADAVAVPWVRSGGLSIGNTQKINLEWWINPMIAISPNGQKIAYINDKNKMRNIMVKSATAGGASVQRTFRNLIMDFSWSPDGNTLCFTELRNNQSAIYLVNSEQGAVVQQISSGSANDYGGVMAEDGNHIFFHRGEGYSTYSLWSYNRANNLFSNYSRGMTPCLISGEPNAFYCARYTDRKECEIWKINYETGVEEVLLSQPGKSFTTPRLSPDGRWILCTGSSVTADSKVANTDIFVMRIDGSQLTQLTYHPGNDISAVWAPDGNAIYFLSSRGTTDGKIYNVWKMGFNMY